MIETILKNYGNEYGTYRSMFFHIREKKELIYQHFIDINNSWSNTNDFITFPTSNLIIVKSSAKYWGHLFGFVLPIKPSLPIKLPHLRLNILQKTTMKLCRASKVVLTTPLCDCWIIYLQNSNLFLENLWP